nr:MAG TPA: hypothetical protein [Caudoviricetes sp.]
MTTLRTANFWVNWNDSPTYLLSWRKQPRR